MNIRTYLPVQKLNKNTHLRYLNPNKYLYYDCGDPNNKIESFFLFLHKIRKKIVQIDLIKCQKL